ncbi:hypothetical protein QBC35DRAFT_468281, partial [Podospora australis]
MSKRKASAISESSNDRQDVAQAIFLKLGTHWQTAESLGPEVVKTSHALMAVASKALTDPIVDLQMLQSWADSFFGALKSTAERDTNHEVMKRDMVATIADRDQQLTERDQELAARDHELAKQAREIKSLKRRLFAITAQQGREHIDISETLLVKTWVIYDREAKKLQKSTFDYAKHASFKNLTYNDRFINDSPNWTIDPTWLNRVAEVTRENGPMSPSPLPIKQRFKRSSTPAGFKLGALRIEKGCLRADQRASRKQRRRRCKLEFNDLFRQDYSVSGSALTVKQSFLSQYLSPTAAPGTKANITVAFSSGAPSQIEIVQWDVPKCSSLTSAASAVPANSDLQIPVVWKGLHRVAAIKIVRADASFLVDDWTVWLPSLQQGRGAFDHYLYTDEYEQLRIDGYGQPESEDVEVEPSQFEPGAEPDEEADLNLEDWQELARAVNLLGCRDIDLNYDWRDHVGQFSHLGFASGGYWTELRTTDPGNYDVEDLPLEARDTLNPEQRLVYDTVIAHYAEIRCGPGWPDQLLMQVDSGGGTGKSSMVKVLSAHLQREPHIGQRSPIVRAAPTGVASNNIGGQTLHSLFRLPVSDQLSQLSESPGTLSTLQREFSGVHYLVIDEKSMIFPDRQDDYFGGVNVILIGDFFQLPPVSATALSGANAYEAFNQSVFLRTIQRQQGKDQAPFRTALEELRKSNCSAQSWELLTTRCAINLTPEEIATFDSALRVYPTRTEVDEYNYDHMLRLESPILSVAATHDGKGAAAAKSDIAGRLSDKMALCVGCRVMLTRNIWNNVGLVNGAQGAISHMSWPADTPADSDVRDSPLDVVMVVFDNYTGPAFIHNGEELRYNGKLAAPILRVRHDGSGTAGILGSGLTCRSLHSSYSESSTVETDILFG